MLITWIGLLFQGVHFGRVYFIADSNRQISYRLFRRLTLNHLQGLRTVANMAQINNKGYVLHVTTAKKEYGNLNGLPLFSLSFLTANIVIPEMHITVAQSCIPAHMASAS